MLPLYVVVRLDGYREGNGWVVIHTEGRVPEDTSLVKETWSGRSFLSSFVGDLLRTGAQTAGTNTRKGGD